MFTKWLDGKPKSDEQSHALGAYSRWEYMVLNANAAAFFPETLTDNQSSTLPVAAFVNWFSLVEYGNIKAGNIILIEQLK